MTDAWLLIGGVLLLVAAFVVIVLGDAWHWWCGDECGSCEHERNMREVRRNQRRSARQVAALAHNRSTLGAWWRALGRPPGRHTNRAPAGKRVRVVLR